MTTFMRRSQLALGALWLVVGFGWLVLAVVWFGRGGMGDPGFYTGLPVGPVMFLAAWWNFRRAHRGSGPIGRDEAA
ncbi:hypothetical protein CryarDRAFT_3447 [Cryptosporangium arvum DSM 44712]|uniref:Uncharacterized protein n=1 Tax=Cryptosporangium arvum DSM 44712 TaxID=927661 RepID=A0A010ZYM1_9ACTN|nr:hypothetical protein CryarDRAFT_3447 [Cryptosporangium arvum DSM 44712]